MKLSKWRITWIGGQSVCNRPQREDLLLIGYYLQFWLEVAGCCFRNLVFWLKLPPCAWVGALVPASCCCESRSVVSDSFRPPGLYSPWNSPGQNTGVDSLSLLQGIFPTQGLKPGLLHCRWILCQPTHKGSPAEELKEKCIYPLRRKWGPVQLPHCCFLTCFLCFCIPSLPQ